LHFSVIFFWLGGMSWHGSYFSNYTSWLRDPCSVVPTAQIVSSIVGQDILNSYLGGNLAGLKISSGLFSVWRSFGVISLSQLKLCSFFGIFSSIAFIIAGYFHLHHSWAHSYSLLGSFSFFNGLSRPFYRSSSISLTLIPLSISTLLWSAHGYHVSSPNLSLGSSHLIDSYFTSSLNFLSFKSLTFYKLPFSSYDTQTPYFSIFCSSGCLSPSVVNAHHLLLGIFIMFSVILSFLGSSQTKTSRTFAHVLLDSSPYSSNSHALLSISLAILGSISIMFSHLAS